MTASATQQRDTLHKGLFSALAFLLQPRRVGELLVRKGRLTQEELQYALVHQRISQSRLGSVLIEHRLISRRDLYGTLAQQLALRYMAATVTFIVSFSGGNSKSARADSLPDVAAEISLVAADGQSPARDYPSLFGSTERSSTNLKPFWKWTGMYARFETEIHDPKYSGALKEWREGLRAFEHLPVPEMAQRVNDMMNAHPYTHDDMHMWGVSDYWETPLEFLTRNGDCKDYAIAKYVSLRMLGIPEDRLRVAIVQDLNKNIPHAVVLLYTGVDILVLDNQNPQVLSSARVTGYKPIYSINRTAWWMNKVQGTTVLASAE